jgi:RNA polymerase sigma factor (sigma-70 family)
MNQPCAFGSVYPQARRAAEVLAGAAISSGRVRRDDREDVIQDALLGLWRELPRFDADRSSIGTFVDRVISSKVASSVRDRRAAKRRLGDDLAPGLEAHQETGEIEFRSDVERVLARLRPFDYLVSTMLAEHSPAETGRLLGVSRSTVYLAIGRIRESFVAGGLYNEQHGSNEKCAIGRTQSLRTAYIVDSRTDCGDQVLTRRNIYREADMPVGGL